jgi:hypothetical protein
MDEGLLPDTPLYRQMTARGTVDDMVLGIHVGRAANERTFPMREPSERISVDMGDGTVLRFDDHLPVNRSFAAIADTFKDSGKAGAVMTRLVALVEMIDAPEMSEWLCPTGPSEDDGLGVYLVVLEVAACFPFTPVTLSFDVHKFVVEVGRVARALEE